jgi:1-acyl-sn-glycerol-3-phosphate acyltransferase
LRPLRLRKQRNVVQIDDVDVVGAEIVRDQLNLGKGVMIMPNHSSHADPYVIYAAADRVETSLYIMATWHVFEGQSFFAQQALRLHGCFSVDREANDIGAFRLATDILREKKQPLVIFPEGEIYHCNERVTPFREGAAAIAVTAARKAKRPIVCIPCAIKYRYVDDPTETLLETMGRLEQSIFWRRQTELPLEERIYRFAEALLAVKELEYFRETRQGQLPERIRYLGEHILRGVEDRHALDGGNNATPERVKAARRVIIAKRSAEGVDKESIRILDQDLEDLFLVVQSFSYPGDYVVAKPTIERMAETLDKFEEDVLSQPTASIKARRRANVRFGEAIEVVGDRKIKGLTTTLTRQVEEQVQLMLDHES